MSGGVVESLASDLDRFQQVVPPGGGSNNWVIAGSRTASGKPLLANDPHLSPTAPPPWYLVQVRTPNWAAAGATFAGAPPIIIGHNGHLAWGVTAGLTDNTDLFLETVSEDGTSVRLGDGTVQACERRQEVISVKGQADVIEEVLITPRGPIISSLVPDLNEAVSLRAIWLDPLPVRGFFDAQHAKNFESFRQGFTRWPCLPLNVVVADANGEIGWQLAGELPRRVGTSGTVPLEPGNAAFGWEAQALPFEEMPFLRNPACGYYATANEHPHERGHPIPENARQSFLGIDFIDPFRGDTIRDELNKQTTGWDIAACLHLQTSVRCLPWEKMKERVLAIPPKSERLSMALDTLRAWDGRIDAESAAAAVYELFVAELATQVMRSRLPQSWPIALGGSGGGAMANNLFGDRRLDQLLGLIQEQPTGWIDQPWADQLAAALEAAILKLQSEMGPAPNWWAWGHYRTLVVKHQIFGTHKLLAPAFNLGPVPCGGDMNTINQAGVSLLQPNRAVSNLPNLRVVIDTGNWSASRVVLCGGQSGNPLSPHYDDLFPLWQRGEAVPLPWTVEDVLRSAKATLRIQPLN
jgi:penicillin amidase